MTIPTEHDPRFSNGLLFDVLAVLDGHGFRVADDATAYADAMVALLALTRAYEGGQR